MYVNSWACWTANALFNATGFIAALSLWDVVLSHKYRRLLWLVPVLLLSAWLESAFNAAVASQTLEQSARLSVPYRRIGVDLLGWPGLGLAFAGLRRALPLGRPKSPASRSGVLEIRAGVEIDIGLLGALERFLEAADHADIEAVVTLYAPGFACVRVADAGGFARITREQMLSFWRRAGMASKLPGGHSVPTRETVLHHAEVIGDTGYVLLTRVKDLGGGWEPMYYSLVWTRGEGDWILLREYVHQRSVPRW